MIDLELNTMESSPPESQGVTVKHWIIPIFLAIVVNGGMIAYSAGQTTNRIDNLQQAVQQNTRVNEQQVNRSELEDMKSDVKEIRQDVKHLLEKKK